jgi:hypothetical protein
MTTQQSTSALSGLSRHLQGRLLVPGDPDWDTARRPWNLRVDQRPEAVVEPEGADDMAATAAFATRHGLRIPPAPQRSQPAITLQVRDRDKLWNPTA